MPPRNVKQPLQDITDSIVLNSIPRRRVRCGAPSSKLGIGRIPSSLPPSSPPSASSQLPEHKLDNFFNENDRPSSLPILSSDDEIPAEGGGKLDTIESGEDGDTSDPSDPFGFFALEKKLKAQRVGASNWKARTQYCVDGDTPLSTPTKEMNKRGIIGVGRLSEGVFSPRTSSLPSTPSPSKPPANRSQAKPRLSGENAEESELVIPKTSKGRPGTNSRVDESPGIRRASVKVVKPKRPIRRAVVTKKQSKAPDSSNNAEQDAPPGSKGRATRNTRKRADRKPRARANNQEALDCDSEELGKKEREHHERVEYFKRLQDYRLEKENVYVI